MVYRVGCVAWPDKQEAVMQIYWTLKSIPELSGLPLGERMRVWRAAHWNIYRHWQFWASLVGMVLCMGIGRHIYVLAVTSVRSLVSSYFGGYQHTWRVHIFVHI